MLNYSDGFLQDISIVSDFYANQERVILFAHRGLVPKRADLNVARHEANLCSEQIPAEPS